MPDLVPSSLLDARSRSVLETVDHWPELHQSFQANFLNAVAQMETTTSPPLSLWQLHVIIAVIKLYPSRII